ncbi:hypothetical protein BD309DRAFT_1051901, partial [Dichomitus squalens]
AILSHTWDSSDEQTYQELKDIQNPYLRFGDKVYLACETAHAAGYPLLWIDSCCIDKRAAQSCPKRSTRCTSGTAIPRSAMHFGRCSPRR